MVVVIVKQKRDGIPWERTSTFVSSQPFPFLFFHPLGGSVWLLRPTHKSLRHEALG